MAYSLATVRLRNAIEPVMEVGGRYCRLADMPDIGPRIRASERGLLGLLEDWQGSHALLRALAEDPAAIKHSVLPADAILDFLTPLQYPAKVICIGLNYRDHLAEIGNTSLRKEETDLSMFFKPPTTTLVGSGRSVIYPKQTQKLDWEVELTVVIGQRARNVPAVEAPRYVAGYTIGVDLSARDHQMNPRHPLKMDTIFGKGFDHSAPVGPRIVPAEFVPDPQALAMELRVNGQIEQRSNTAQMIWTIAEQIEAITRHITLEPGDLIMTGTPAGVGLFKNRFLKPGDRLDAQIERLGILAFEMGE